MSDAQAEFPLTFVFQRGAEFCAFPTGQWERVGPADEQGRTAIRVTFRNRAEYAAALFASAAIAGQRDEAQMAYEAWGNGTENTPDGPGG